MFISVEKRQDRSIVKFTTVTIVFCLRARLIKIFDGKKIFFSVPSLSVLFMLLKKQT